MLIVIFQLGEATAVYGPFASEEERDKWVNLMTTIGGQTRYTRVITFDTLKSPCVFDDLPWIGTR